MNSCAEEPARSCTGPALQWARAYVKWQCWGQYLGAKAGAGPNGLKGLFFRWLGTDARRDDVGICSRNVKRREKALQEHAAKQSDPKILEACEQALAAMQKAAR